MIIIPKDLPPLEDVELLIFVLDGSGSMMWKKTFDGRAKVDHQTELTRGVLKRIKTGGKSQKFRGSLIYFSENVIKDKITSKFYGTLNQLEIKNAVDVAGGQDTALADALIGTKEVIDEFLKDKSLPKDKEVTIFLFTDGQETVKKKKDVEDAHKKLVDEYGDLLKIATTSFGSDADTRLLIKIASKMNDKQFTALDNAGVMHHIPVKDKLYMEGHVDNKITKNKIEAIRNFVSIISGTD